MLNIKDETVWITGASSGIGLEMTLLASGQGAHLVLFSSRKEALAEAASLATIKGAASVRIYPVDLSDNAAAQQVSRQALDEGAIPRVVILNAGVSQRSLAIETDFAVTERILRINFLSAVAMTRIVLPEMVRNGGGHIGVTSSLVGVHGFPLRSAYSASKHALHGYFETVRIENWSDKIKVTMAIPGRIHTPISTRSLEGDGRRHDKMDPGQAKGLPADVCAQKYLKAVLKGRKEVVVGKFEVITVFLKRRFQPAFYWLARRVSAE